MEYEKREGSERLFSTDITNSRLHGEQREENKSIWGKEKARKVKLERHAFQRPDPVRVRGICGWTRGREEGGWSQKRGEEVS